MPRDVFEPRLADWMQSDDERVLDMAMDLVIAGGVWSSKHFKRVEAGVKKALGHRSEWVRRHACDALLALNGQSACRDIAPLTSDENDDVRAYATMVLLMSGDKQHIDAITTGCSGLADWDSQAALALVWAIERWAMENVYDTELRSALIPALIHLLGDPGRSYNGFGLSWWVRDLLDEGYQGWGNAALQAQRVLYEMTELHFPFDVEQAMQAWRDASGLSYEEREALFESRFPNAYSHHALSFRAKRGSDRFELTMYNLGDTDMWFLLRPNSAYATRVEEEKIIRDRLDRQGLADGELVHIPAGTVYRFSLPFAEDMPDATHIELEYSSAADKPGIINWRGRLRARIER